MTLTTQDRILIESRITNDGPSVGVAYLLWFFLGLFSAHRFYLGRPGSAILQILSYFILIGFFWILIDGFLIPGMIRKKQDELRQRLMLEAMSYAPSASHNPAAAPALAQAASAPQAAFPAQLPKSSDLISRS